jgi:hypothetical protein
MSKPHQPTFQYIAAGDLVVHPKAQRSLRQPDAEKIADTWNAAKLGTLTVVRMENGQLAIVDGQHRHKGALLKYGRSVKLPCLVHEKTSLAEDADLFIGLNDSRRVQATDLFNARVVRRDETAVTINDILARHGWIVRQGSSAGTIAAIGAFEKVFDGIGVTKGKSRADLVEATIATITGAWSHDPTGVNAAIVQGLGAMHARFGPQIDRGKLSRNLAGVRPVEIVASARSIRDAQRGTLGAAAARVMVGIYNNRARTGRLPEWTWTK